MTSIVNAIRKQLPEPPSQPPGTVCPHQLDHGPDPGQGLSLIVLAWVDLLHLAELRRTPEREAEIYATPGTAYLRRRLARERTAAAASH